MSIAAEVVNCEVLQTKNTVTFCHGSYVLSKEDEYVFFRRIAFALPRLSHRLLPPRLPPSSSSVQLASCKLQTIIPIVVV